MTFIHSRIINMNGLLRTVGNMLAIAICLLSCEIKINNAASLMVQTRNQTRGNGYLNETNEHVLNNDTSTQNRFKRSQLTNAVSNQRICTGVEPEYCDGVDISQAAYCPWTYQPNIDMNRKPQLIYEAVCDCSSIVGSGFECRRVYRSIYVKIKCRSTGHRYVDSTVLVAVACVPVLPCSRSA